jgi:hypothetical protein
MTQHLPRFRALLTGGKTLRPALVFIISTRWLIALLELGCLEEEEEVDPPILRVQAPLYRQGPGYKMLSGYQLLCGRGTSMGPASFCPSARA